MCDSGRVLIRSLSESGERRLIATGTAGIRTKAGMRKLSPEPLRLIVGLLLNFVCALFDAAGRLVDALFCRLLGGAAGLFCRFGGGLAGFLGFLAGVFDVVLRALLRPGSDSSPKPDRER